MRPASRFPRRHAIALVLAGLACLAQSLCGLLPEPVVCLRLDRPARGELFSGSCSCRHQDHDRTAHGGPAARRFEAGCVDVLLAAPALLAAAGVVRRAAEGRSGPAPLPAGITALAPASAAPAACRPAWRGSPPAGFPLTGLRC